ncbi:hypothetical protein V0288_08055 [Pannus brasiliensis CCIBt3594]|uniref:Uncharacterized protein n=1 Tax=Pannus brasiliensis CCIBt3594 TaxID=1427578 RepID=A0AAW9QWG7_9CHRO
MTGLLRQRLTETLREWAEIIPRDARLPLDLEVKTDPDSEDR